MCFPSAGFPPMNSNLRWLLICWVFSLMPALAQSPPEVKVRFRTLGWMVAPDDLYYKVKGGDAKVSIIDAARSVFYDAPTDKKNLVFYRLVPGPDGKNVREPAAEVDISSAGPMPLLIFMGNPDDPKNYRVAAIADDLKAFPFPCCRFVNFTPVELFAKYGDQKVKVAAKGIELIDPRLKSMTEPETRYTSVSMMTEEGPRLLYSNNWVAHPTQRTLVFVFALDGQFHIMRIADSLSLHLPPTKPKP